MTEMDVTVKAKQLCECIYKVSASLPLSEQFGLSNQIRRAAISIVSNLTEGNSYTDGNKNVLFSRAYGSCQEVKVQLEMMQRLFNIDIESVYQTADKVGAMIFKLKSVVGSRESV
jgi:four helix bundle protein